MSTDLHEQLADELGISPAAAERALGDLLSDVSARAQSGEEVAIPNLGAFHVDEEALHFTPNSLLQKAVNYRNDHLAPLTVTEATARPADEPDAPPSPTPEEEVRPVDDEPASVEEPVDQMPEEPVADTRSPDPEKVPDLSENWTKELDEEPRSTRPPTRRGAAAHSKRSRASAASTSQMVGLTVSVVVLGLLIWFVLSLQSVVPGPGTLFRSASAPAGGPDTAALATPSPDTATAGAPAPPPADAPRPDEPPPTPPTIDRASGGWTLVVASRTRPAEAEAVLETYQQRFLGEGLPVDIVTGTSGGQIRYRVAVGQYATSDAALAALRELGDRLPDDAWATRIGPNS